MIKLSILNHDNEILLIGIQVALGVLATRHTVEIV